MRIHCEINELLYIFKRYTNNEEYFDFTKKEEFLNKFELLIKFKSFTAIFILNKELRNNIFYLFNIKNNIDEIQKNYNKSFIENEKNQYKDFFYKLIENQPFDNQQIESIITDEKNSLVIAGAGTGKTSTIIGKTAYILEKKLAEPEQILLIAFTKKAANEIYERINELIKTHINIHTFHSIGYNIIGVSEKFTPDLYLNGEDSKIKETLKELIENSFLNDTKNIFLDFFAFKLRPEKPKFEFKTLNDYYQHLKAHDIRTLKNERVKSFEELKISNFLFINSVDYKYESPYEVDLSTPTHRQYHPDFYLPNFDIYIEHFAIDEHGNVPPFFTNRSDLPPKEKYNNEIKWKRETHKKYGTKLIETYSYENKRNVLLDNLKMKLVKSNVQLNLKSKKEILDQINSNNLLNPFVELMFSFLNLAKSNLISISELEEKSKIINDDRFSAFIECYKIIYKKYDNILKQSKAIDFSDMINMATECVKYKKYISNFKYIIVDEFQDLSVGRYKLINELLNQKKGSKLFAVGDDWQSIFRFAGSDITLMSNIEKYFGFTQVLKIEQTYRFNDKILEISSKFIQKNKSQLKKNLFTKNNINNENAFEIITIDNNNPLEKNIKRILNECRNFKNDAKVLFIARFNHDKIMNFQSYKNNYPTLDLEFVTAHKSKGLTCDFSIILNMISGKWGFPSEISDDPILDYILSENESFENAEERRLFYVAITRAKYKNFIFTSNNNKSKFILELEKDLGLVNDPNFALCDLCGGTMQRKQNRFGRFFYSCTNYPFCNYTRN